MLMFLLHIAFSSCLLAVAAGLVLLYIAKKADAQGCGTCLRIGGYIVLIASCVSIVCLSYYAVRYAEDDSYSKPYPQTSMMGAAGGMPDMMRMMGGMMKNSMTGGKGQPPMKIQNPDKSEPDQGPGPQDEEHHPE